MSKPVDLNHNSTNIRPFDYANDLDAVKRIWQEVGWVDEEEEIAQLDDFFAAGHTLVGTINDVAECSVHVTSGSLRLATTDLNLCAVTAVTTSRIARGNAFAQRLTALQLQNAANNGAHVSALGMFDQGFYDKLGFGSGSYEHRFCFDPSTLKINAKANTPSRLTLADSEAIHAAMVARQKHHGSVNLDSAQLFRAELGFNTDSFGLGYHTDGKLSHFVWLKNKDEHGPYTVLFMGYQNSQQLLELLALLKSLSDQVFSLKLVEPPELQLQMLLERPFRNMDLSENSDHASEHESYAWWQMRILDLQACIGVLPGDYSLQFNLKITDPVEKFLDSAQGWTGVGGEYIVSLGADKSIEQGVDTTLASLTCDVNSFTRWLWGIAPAKSLLLTDNFSCDESLAYELERCISFKDPKFGWDF